MSLFVYKDGGSKGISRSVSVPPNFWYFHCHIYIYDYVLCSFCTTAWSPTFWGQNHHYYYQPTLTSLTGVGWQSHIYPSYHRVW